MVKNRLIPCLFLRNGTLVQSYEFKRYRMLGTPTIAVARYNEWSVDELVYIDITPGQYSGLGRSDTANASRNNLLDIIRDISKQCFMPLTFGGGIRSLKDIEDRLSSGADKITINTAAIDKPDFITESAKEFGSQCIILSVDTLPNSENKHVVVRAKEALSLSTIDWVKQGEDLGAGEIFLNSVDRDGKGEGYDLEILSQVSDAVRIPVIACGGVGKWDHFADGISKGGAHAVAAANIFSHKEQSVMEAKRFLVDAGLNFRSDNL